MEHPPPLPASAPLLLRALFKRAPSTPAAIGEPVRTAFVAGPADRERLARYCGLLGFPEGAVPLTFHYLPSQRAQLATMLDAGFPFRVAGMIHVANDMRADAAYDPARPMELHTSAAVAPPTDKGAVHLLVKTCGRQDGRDIFICASDYLAVRGSRGARQSAAAAQLHPVAGWMLDSDSGRRYAAVSGDWNPIHLSGWTARLMGLRAPIIHGMHTVAKCCAALETAYGRHVTAISARFTAPVALPGAVALSADLGAGAYTASSGGRDAVTGRFTLAQAQHAAA